MTGLPRWTRDRLRTSLGWSLVAALTLWAVVRLDWRLAQRSLRRVDLAAYLACIAAFAAGNLLLDVLASKVTYERTVAPVRYRDLLAVRGASYLPGLVSFHAGQAFVTFFLSRVLGAPLAQVAGATLCAYATTFGALVLLALFSLPWALSLVPGLVAPVLGLALLGLAYLALLGLRPAWLARYTLGASLVRLGVLGHLLVTSLRLAQVSLLAFGTWLAYSLAGVSLPARAAAAYLPSFLLVSAVPITPQGIGTRDAFALWLFRPWAPSVEAIAAAGVLFAVSGVIAQVVLGTLLTPACRARFDASRAGPDAPAPPGTWPGATG